MRYILLAMAMTGCGCGPTSLDFRTDRTPVTWNVIDSTTISVTASSKPYVVAPINTNIQWTEPERGTFTINCTIAVDDTDPDLLQLGTCVVDKLRVNKLKVCGVGGDEKCTDALIRMYTTGSFPGFINTTEGYGVPFMSDGNEVGLTDPNALSLSTYIIPTNRKRINHNLFNDISYDLSIDMSNAGIGDYELDIVIELLLGN